MSKFKVVFAQFLSKFWLIFFWFWACMAQYMLRSTACLINWTICLAFAVFLLVFATLMKKIVEKDKNYFFKSVEKTCIITVKPNKSWWYQVSCLSWYILSHIASESKEKNLKSLTKNEQKQLWILTLFFWSCWGCLRSKKFQMVDQA